MPRPARLRLDPILIRGQEYSVEISPGDGRFHATFDGAELQAESREDLVARLRDASTRARAARKIAIPVASIDHHSNGLRKGVITGTNAATGNLLVLWDGGKREQIASYERHRLLDPERLGQDGMRELLTLREELDKREKRLRELTDQAAFVNLDKAIEAASTA